MELIACARDSEHAIRARNATASDATSVHDVHSSFEAIAQIVVPMLQARWAKETGRLPVEVVVHFEFASGKDLHVPVALLTGENRYTTIRVLRLQTSFHPGRHPATTT